MDYMKVISEDEEIQELKRIIKNNGGHVPGFGFWDVEMIEEYRIRLRKVADYYEAQKSSGCKT